MLDRIHDATECRRLPEQRVAFDRRWWLGLAGLLIVAITAHFGDLTARHLLSDESLHVNAAAMVRAGQSAFDVPGYLGTPLFAHAISWLGNLIGAWPSVLAVRALNALAATAIAWLASAEVHGTPRVRWAVAALLVIAAPPLEEGLRAGNPSILANAATLLMVAIWSRRPVIAGLALGIGLAVKPYAVALLPVLLAARPGPPSHRNLTVGLIGGSVFALALLTLPSELARMLASHENMGVGLRSMSLQRMAVCFFGWGPRTSAVIVVVIAVAVVYTCWRRRSEREIAHIAILASLFALTRIWLHVLALTLPWACGVLADRLRGARAAWHCPPPARQRQILRLLLSTAVVIVLYNGDVFVALNIVTPTIPGWLDGIATLLPLVALVVLFLQSRALARPQEPGRAQV